MDVNKLKGKMREKKYTQATLAKKLDITTQSLSAKLNNRSQFTLSEVVKMIDVLEIENPAKIFFAPNISNKQQNRKN